MKLRDLQLNSLKKFNPIFLHLTMHENDGMALQWLITVTLQHPVLPLFGFHGGVTDPFSVHDVNNEFTGHPFFFIEIVHFCHGQWYI